MFHLKLLFQFSFILFSYSSEINGDIIPPMVGGQRDSNNCLIGAGFTWCDSSQECIRKWETPCADNYNNCSDCLKKQRKGENIACPLECDNAVVDCINDDDCGHSYFCRPVTSNNKAKECYAYSKEGDSCGGHTLPMYESRCRPSLECTHSKSGIRPSAPMIVDAPGTCMRHCDQPTVRNE